MLLKILEDKIIKNDEIGINIGYKEALLFNLTWISLVFLLVSIIELINNDLTQPSVLFSILAPLFFLLYVNVGIASPLSKKKTPYIKMIYFFSFFCFLIILYLIFKPYLIELILSFSSLHYVFTILGVATSVFLIFINSYISSASIIRVRRLIKKNENNKILLEKKVEEILTKDDVKRKIIEYKSSLPIIYNHLKNDEIMKELNLASNQMAKIKNTITIDNN